MMTINPDQIFQNHINEFNKYLKNNMLTLKEEYSDHILDMWEQNGKDLSNEQFKDLVSTEKKDFYFLVFKDFTKEFMPEDGNSPITYKNVNFSNFFDVFEDFVDLNEL